MRAPFDVETHAARRFAPRRRTRRGRSPCTRPSDPPSEIGLPVTTPVAVPPTFIEYVSIIHAMICSLVLTSGAGISLFGPMMMPISLV